MPTLPLSLGLLVVCCIVTVALGYPFIALLRHYGVGKRIRIDGPRTHEQKMGTPTMGGLLICGGVVVATVIVTLTVHRGEGRSVLVPLLVLLTCAALGGVDDLLTLVGQAGSGLTVKMKFGCLTVLALLAALAIWLPQGIDRDVIFIPTRPPPGEHLGFWFVPLGVLAILGTANALNLTDGLDSLAATSAAWSFFAYGVIALLQGQAFLVSFCFTVVGALLGFLWFNAHPAQVFMGDTGSLAIGGALGTVAILLKAEFLLLLIGGVFAAEAISVLVQTGAYKWHKRTRGREYADAHRVFRMAPLHHHFEKLGWAETTVVTRFYILGLLCALVALSTLKVR